MKIPEYTLKQAISIYEMISHQYWQHVNGGCGQCIGWFAEGPHCEKGRVLMLMHNKWIARMKRVAESEGVEITLPTPITERTTS